MASMKRAYVWGIACIVLMAAALVMPYVAVHDPIQTSLDSINQAPSATYFLGTDAVGRCIACRIMYGLGTSLFTSLGIVVISACLGSVIGLVSGYAAGVVDALIMRMVDACMAIPTLVLSIAVAGILGGGLVNAVIALVATDWTRYARIARAQSLVVRQETFVQAAYISGVPAPLIVLRHVLPNILPPLIVTAVLDVGGMMLNLAGLSFLGLGAAPPAPELGAMINQAAAMFQITPWAVFAPGAAIVIAVVVFNAFGDAVNEVVSERLAR